MKRRNKWQRWNSTPKRQLLDHDAARLRQRQGRPMNVAQAINYAQSLGLERLDAQLLTLHALGRATSDRAWLLAHGDHALPGHAQAVLEANATRRACGEPLAYLTGIKEFYGLALQVDARVLDPRADTETLVDWALECMDAWTPCNSSVPPTLIDLGTGSGAIALALQQQRPLWQVHALDCSADALDVARSNAARLHLRVQFHQGAWMQQVRESFAVIVSNPPYIAAQDAHLAALTHEPVRALVSGVDGLDDIRAIIHQAPKRLQAGGWLLLEHGYDQAEAVRALLMAAGFNKVQSRCDLAGIERCSGGQRPLQP
jgi:release factor glutamine methyltransferase